MKLTGLAVAVLSLFSLALLGGCEALKDATEKVIEAEAGCDETQLGKLNEPDLPYCSKAAACCKFIKGECGKVTLFTPPKEIVDACNLNEAVLKGIIEEYQGISDAKCPAYLTDAACKDGQAKTKENYRKALDEGDVSFSKIGSPNCQFIVDETVNTLNEKLGAAASMLPEACEPVTVNKVEKPIEDIQEEPDATLEPDAQ